jgi:hypothetical protein
MQSKFSESILEMQQKSGLKYLILEKKISTMKEELDVKEAQLHAVVEQGPPKKGLQFFEITVGAQNGILDNRITDNRIN